MPEWIKRGDCYSKGPPTVHTQVFQSAILCIFWRQFTLLQNKTLIRPHPLSLQCIALLHCIYGSTIFHSFTQSWYVATTSHSRINSSLSKSFIIHIRNITPLSNSSASLSFSRMAFSASFATPRALSALVTAPCSHDNPPQIPHPAPPHSGSQGSPRLSHNYTKHTNFSGNYDVL